MRLVAADPEQSFAAAVLEVAHTGRKRIDALWVLIAASSLAMRKSKANAIG